MKAIICAHLRAGFEITKKIISYDYFDKIIVFTYAWTENRKFIEFLKVNNIEFYTKNINLFKDKISLFKPDFLFSIYYRDIIEKEILNAVKKRAINLHPSLLPRHKGTFSAPWAILDGDEYTGITYHEMTEKVDSGNILLQKKLKISKEDTAYSLYNKLVDLGVNTFDEFFENFIIKMKKGKPQQGKGSYHKRKVPFNGFIDLSWDIDFIERFIRAMYFPPHKCAILMYKGKEYEFCTFEEFVEFCRKEEIQLK